MNTIFAKCKVCGVAWEKQVSGEAALKAARTDLERSVREHATVTRHPQAVVMVLAPG